MPDDLEKLEVVTVLHPKNSSELAGRLKVCGVFMKNRAGVETTIGNLDPKAEGQSKQVKAIYLAPGEQVVGIKHRENAKNDHL